MSTQLQAMVEFLSGGEGAGSYRIRSELADPEGDAARFLAAARRLSRDVLAPHVFKGLGLPPSARGRVPDVPPPLARAAQRRFPHILPWLITALSTGAVLWLLLTCPCHHPKPDGPGQAAALVPPAGGEALLPIPSAERKPSDPAPSGITAPSLPSKDDPPARAVIAADKPKAFLPRGDDDVGLLKQIADLKSRLEAGEAEAAAIRGQRTDLLTKMRGIEVENDRLGRQTAGLRQEAAGLEAQIEQLGKNRAKAIETAVTNQTALLQENLGKAREELRTERAGREQLQKQFDEQIRALSVEPRAKQKEQRPR
jgi:hypothetical protein